MPGYTDGKPGAGGSAPFSELETSQLRSLLLDLTKNFQRVILVILHSTVSRTQGEVFAGYSTSASRFDPESERLAKILQTRLGYTYSTVWDYKTPGMRLIGVLSMASWQSISSGPKKHHLQIWI